jgi:PAS domain S-box-containing protein
VTTTNCNPALDPASLDALLDILDTGIVFTDRDFRIIRTNQWMAKTFAEKKPLSGKHFFSDLFGLHADVPRFADLEPHTPLKLSLGCPCSLSSEAWFNLTAVRQADGDGRPVGAIIQVQDITTHKATEARLVEEAHRRRILFDQSRDGIVIVDQNGKAVEANQRYADMLGYSLKEVHQLYVWDWDDQWNEAELKQMVDEVDHTGDHFETRHRRKDGTVYEVEISSNGIIFGGEKQILCICRDITERKQAEMERERLIGELQAALKEIRTLEGILPLCSFCKKIRNADGSWEPVDMYIYHHSQADISHSICPDCLRTHYPEACDD